MAPPVQWTDLPGCMVYSIAELLNPDIDLLRLRSVCSSWRSSLPAPQKPVSFPLKLPPISPFQNPNEQIGYCTLSENSLYRISPPNDPSNGWMFKISDSIANPNTNNFSLLIPLSTDKMNCPPGTIPKQLNLLDYHISEICKSYSIRELDHDGSSMDVEAFESVKKVVTLLNYMADSDFAVLSLHVCGKMDCWKFGDENWTSVDTKGHKINDMCLYDGKCLAIDSEGVLVEFDSELELKVIASSAGTYPLLENRLVECETDLYLVSTAFFSDDLSSQWETFVEFPLDFALMLSRFNKCNGSWDRVRGLEDKVFLLGEDVSVGVLAKDFKGCEGNCMYLTHWCFINDSESDVYGDSAGVYHLDNRKAVRMAMDGDSRKLYWPPPSWLMSSASSRSFVTISRNIMDKLKHQVTRIFM